MHVQTITEQELADFLEETIDIACWPGGVTQGLNASVRRFVLIQGMMSDEIVLVSELPIPVMPADPTPEELAEFAREGVPPIPGEFAAWLDG